jgi:REP-associated tyrosine transposase
MTRPIRVEFENAVYHVSARGNERKPIFRDDADRLRFLQTLEEMVSRFGVVVHAYCLMLNHHHLLLQTTRANLSAAAGWLQATYSIRFNRRHRRSGHLYQGRFKAHLVEEDSYARQLINYIHLNPVRPKDKRKPIPPNLKGMLSRYRWSSHRAYAGVEHNPTPEWLCLDWLSYFQSKRRAAQEEYRRGIDQMFGEVVPSPWKDLRHGLVLGSEPLWQKARRLITQAPGDEEIRWQKRVDGETHSRRVQSLVAREADRRVAIWIRVRLGGERMTTVAAEYGYRDGSGIHRVIQRLEQAASADKSLHRRLNDLTDKLSSVKS